MLYEMVTGRVPFSNIDEQTILSQHLEEAAAQPSHSRGDVVLASQNGVVIGNLPPLLDGVSPGEDEIAHGKMLVASSQVVTLLGEGEWLALAIGAHLTDQFLGGGAERSARSNQSAANHFCCAGHSTGSRSTPDCYAD